MLLTDTHIHILPGIDTGPIDATEAAAMFTSSYEAGVRTFVATPHYFCDRETISEFLLHRRAAFRRLAETVGRRIYHVLFLASAEVMLMPGVSRIPDLPSLAIPGTNLLPVDFPLADRITDDVMRELAYIVQKRKLRPLFCHVERHFEFFSPEKFENQLLAFTHGAFCISAQAFPNQELAAPIIRALNKEKLFFLCSNGHGVKSRPATLLPHAEVSGFSAFAYRRILSDTNKFFAQLRSELSPHRTFT